MAAGWHKKGSGLFYEKRDLTPFMGTCLKRGILMGKTIACLLKRDRIIA